jgi:hypothetical protein
MSLSVNQTIVNAEGVEHYKRLRDFLKPLGIRNNVAMAYDLSAAYNLKDEMEVAPSQFGQFTAFGEFTEAHVQTLFDEIEKRPSELSAARSSCQTILPARHPQSVAR